MSPLDLLVPDATEATPFSVRLAARRAQQGLAIPEREPSKSDRRLYQRRQGNDLDWIRLVRLSRGADVRLIDLSEGGALIEVDSPLKPGTLLSLEISGTGLDATVPLEVLRCYIANLRGEVTTYRGAVAFTRPIELPTNSRTRPGGAAAFVGTDAALTYLLHRCAVAERESAAGDTQKAAFARTEILHVLEALHARKPAIGADPMGRYTAELLGAMLPPLQRGASRELVLAALEHRFNGFPERWQSRLQATFGRLGSIVACCTTPVADAGAFVESAPSAPAGAPAIPDAAPADAAPIASQTDSAFQKIVVRFASGAIIKGFTQDFHPARAHFSLWPTINATPADRVVVPVTSLKAVFFVRDFHGNPAYRERKTFTVRGQGRRVEVTFSDGEVALGTTLNYRPDGQGFFLVPADAGGNNTRIYVVVSAVRRVRFL